MEQNKLLCASEEKGQKESFGTDEDL